MNNIKIGDKVKFTGKSYLIKTGSVGVVTQVFPPLAKFKNGESSMFKLINKS